MIFVAHQVAQAGVRRGQRTCLAGESVNVAKLRMVGRFAFRFRGLPTCFVVSKESLKNTCFHPNMAGCSAPPEVTDCCPKRTAARRKTTGARKHATPVSTTAGNEVPANRNGRERTKPLRGGSRPAIATDRDFRCGHDVRQVVSSSTAHSSVAPRDRKSVV